jgi:hypothetical protein
MLFFPKTQNIAKILALVVAAGYVTQKIDYNQNPFEKHLSWLGFNVGWGALIG